MAARVELFEAIRTDRRREQLSVRALAERHQVHRRTVRQALDSSLPPPRKTYPRSKPAIAPWTDIIDAWLEADESVPRKQRHTARRIWQRLGAEHDARPLPSVAGYDELLTRRATRDPQPQIPATGRTVS